MCPQRVHSYSSRCEHLNRKYVLKRRRHIGGWTNFCWGLYEKSAVNRAALTPFPDLQIAIKKRAQVSLSTVKKLSRKIKKKLPKRRL